ncbi:response regulator transcription factor [Arthrobacter sp. LAPM80]|uniref:response regulator transcription factor n=1 Tax=Arthrobacter sp. LAPM80 TaxID=3141788 RepID=UPI00398A75EA
MNSSLASGPPGCLPTTPLRARDGASCPGAGRREGASASFADTAPIPKHDDGTSTGAPLRAAATEFKPWGRLSATAAHVVLMDVSMPSMDGMETTRRLMARTKVAPMPSEPSPANDANASAVASVTAREHEFFVLICNGLSNPAIAMELFVSEATVKTHVGHILAKLHARDRVQVDLIAFEAGIVSSSTKGLTLDRSRGEALDDELAGEGEDHQRRDNRQHGCGGH